MSADTRIAQIPSMDDLIAVVEMAASGTTEYDRLSEVAERVLEGYPADEAEYMGEIIPELTVGQTHQFRGGTITVTRTSAITFEVTDVAAQRTIQCVSAAAAVAAADEIEV